MTLTTNGLNWLADHAGSGGCFTSSGVSYRDADGVSHTGGTKDVVNAFLVAHMVDKPTVNIIDGTNYNEFRSINGGTDLAIGDISEAADREADGGSYPRYCSGGGGTVCTPGARRCRTSTVCEQCLSDGSGWYDVETCPSGYVCRSGHCVAEGSAGDLPVTGPLEVYIGEGSSCPPGTPNVTLDEAEAFAFFKSVPYKYVGVGGIQVHNLSSSCQIYVAWEMKLWDGEGFTTCPTSSPEVQEINRFLAEPGDRPLSLKRIDSDGTDVVWGSFEVPDWVTGKKTICLSLWGNNDYDALVAELNSAGYYDKT